MPTGAVGDRPQAEIRAVDEFVFIALTDRARMGRRRGAEPAGRKGAALDRRVDHRGGSGHSCAEPAAGWLSIAAKIFSSGRAVPAKFPGATRGPPSVHHRTPSEGQRLGSASE